MELELGQFTPIRIKSRGNELLESVSSKLFKEY